VGLSRTIAAWALALGFAVAASAQERMQIQFAEAVEISSAPGSTQFDAYGRRFALELAANEGAISKLSAVRKAELSGVRLLRGKLAGNASSWIRLTKFAGRVEGVIWDGRDLYSITSYERIARHLTTPLDVGPGQTVVFRLSDTLNALPSAFCATAPSPEGLATNNGLVQYRKLVADLPAAYAMSVLMTRQVEISLIADAAFQNTFPAATSAELLARFNVAEGIFGEQAALLLRPTDVRLAPAAPDPFTSTHPPTLLNQLSTFRLANDQVKNRGIAHLVTGKDLDGDTAGIAMLSSACDAEDAVSLSEGTWGVSLGGLIMAHEFGHNLGAEHDGAPGGACAFESQFYLMAPVLSGRSEFSQCSLASMRAIIDHAACITPAVYAHVEIAPGATPVTLDDENPGVLGYTVRSSGTLAAESVRFTVTLDAMLSAIAVSPANLCTISDGNVSCDLGNLAAGAERQVDVTVVPNGVGTIHDVEAQVTATNNQHSRDSTQARLVYVQRNVAGDVSIVAVPSTVLTGDTVDFNVTVHSLRSHALLDVRVSLSSPGMTLNSVTSGPTCTFSGNTAVCLLGDIPGGETRQFTVRALANATGDMTANAYLFAANLPFESSHSVSTVVHLNPRRDVGIEIVDDSRFSAFNEPFDFNANVRAYGVEPVNDVTLSLDVSTPFSTSAGIESVTIGGVECLPAQLNHYQCALSSMAAGEIRRVVVHGRGVALGNYAFLLRTSAALQDNLGNDQLSRGITIMHPVDVAVNSGSSMNGTESVEFSGHVTVSSNGMLVVPTSQVTVTLPAQARFTRQFTDTGSCTIQDPQHLQCTLAFTYPGQRADISWMVVSDSPGAYSITVSAVTPNDAVPTNDTVQMPLNITALVDVGVEQFAVPQFLLTGRDYDIPVNITVGSRPVSGATVRVVGLLSAQVRSVAIPSGTCLREDAQRLQCTLGAFAANSTIPIIITVASLAPPGTSILSVEAFAAGDNNQTNNVKNAFFNTIEPGDLQLSVAATTVTGVVGGSLAYPRISIRHAGPIADGRFEVSLPAFVTLSSVVTPAVICSGTTLLQCDLPSGWPENQALEIDLLLAANAAGTFTSTVRVLSENDANAANDQASVTVTVNAATSPPSNPPANPPSGSSSGGGGDRGGGGGGRLEWALLAALGLMAARRLTLAIRQPRSPPS